MSHSSFLTEAEVTLLQNSGLHRNSPYIIRGVSQTQFSVARYYAAIIVNGESYEYLDLFDELIRRDVLKWITNHRNPPKLKKAAVKIIKRIQKTLDL